MNKFYEICFNINYRILDELHINNNPLIRWLLISAGLIFVGIGTVGMFLPLLPTTIFFILAAWCFARSSEKFYHWLHYNRWFGKFFRNYRRGHGMTLKSKISSLLLLWLGISLSAVYATDALYVRILLLLIALGVSWHIISLRTAKEPNTL